MPRAAAEVDGASSVVVLRPQSAADADDAWKRALVDDPETAVPVGISLSKQPSAWYERWCDALDTEPEAAAVVTTPELARGDSDDVEARTVATPSNLTGIGVKTTPYLDRWDDVIVCIESLTVLFQYATTREVYQFLHVLLTQVRSNGGAAQAYVDPMTGDERTVELVKSLFDGIVEYDADGDGEDAWDARSR